MINSQIRFFYIHTHSCQLRDVLSCLEVLPLMWLNFFASTILFMSWCWELFVKKLFLRGFCPHRLLYRDSQNILSTLSRRAYTIRARKSAELYFIGPLCTTLFIISKILARIKVQKREGCPRSSRNFWPSHSRSSHLERAWLSCGEP